MLYFVLFYHVVFGKTMNNVKKHRDIKLVTKEARTNYLVSEPNYHTTIFSEYLVAIEMKKIQIFTNEPIYGEKAKLCYMDTDGFIVHIKKDIYIYIARNVETRFDCKNDW